VAQHLLGVNLGANPRDQATSKHAGRTAPRPSNKVKPDMKTISLALAAVIAATALVPAASAKQSKKMGHSPFVTYSDPYTGEDMTVYRPDYYVPSNDFEGGHFPGNYALRKAEGKCVMDLGYGRWQNCK
jgi:hypothetical protein